MKKVTSMQLLLWGKLPLRFHKYETMENKVGGVGLVFKGQKPCFGSLRPSSSHAAFINSHSSLSVQCSSILSQDTEIRDPSEPWDRDSELLPGGSRIAQHLINSCFLING